MPPLLIPQASRPLSAIEVKRPSGGSPPRKEQIACPSLLTLQCLEIAMKVPEGTSTPLEWPEQAIVPSFLSPQRGSPAFETETKPEPANSAVSPNSLVPQHAKVPSGSMRCARSAPARSQDQAIAHNANRRGRPVEQSACAPRRENDQKKADGAKCSPGPVDRFAEWSNRRQNETEERREWAKLDSNPCLPSNLEGLRLAAVSHDCRTAGSASFFPRVLSPAPRATTAVLLVLGGSRSRRMQCSLARSRATLKSCL